MLSNREGQRVPNVTFRTRQNNQWVDVTTDDLSAVRERLNYRPRPLPSKIGAIA